MVSAALRPMRTPAPARCPGAVLASMSATNGAVRRVIVGEEGEGQRLDNYLVKTLKGVPKSHIYRIVRSGEVRVNRGRAISTLRPWRVGEGSPSMRLWSSRQWWYWSRPIGASGATSLARPSRWAWECCSP